MGSVKPSVYLVEDDPAVAEVYRLGLETRGFTVTVAGSGDELFGLLNGRRPDVILLDYQLPGRNGAEVLEMIRDHEQTRPAMVFMLSNFPPTHEGAIDRVVAHGVMGWFEKTKTPPAVLADRLGDALHANGSTRPGESDPA